MSLEQLCIGAGKTGVTKFDFPAERRVRDPSKRVGQGSPSVGPRLQS